MPFLRDHQNRDDRNISRKTVSERVGFLVFEMIDRSIKYCQWSRARLLILQCSKKRQRQKCPGIHRPNEATVITTSVIDVVFSSEAVVATCSQQEGHDVDIVSYVLLSCRSGRVQDGTATWRSDGAAFESCTPKANETFCFFLPFLAFSCSFMLFTLFCALF